jgi:hypothetical protein
MVLKSGKFGSFPIDSVPLFFSYFLRGGGKNLPRQGSCQ